MAVVNEKLSFLDAWYFGAGRVAVADHVPIPDQVPTEVIGDTRVVPYICIDQLFQDVMHSVEIIPQWWQDGLDQIEQMRSYASAPCVIVLPDEDFLVVGRYSEGFYSWLEENTDCEDISFDRFAGGVYVASPEWPEDTNSNLGKFEISTTRVSAEFITPVTQRSLRLRAFADQAIKDGYELPSRQLFPTRQTLYSHQEVAVYSLAKRGGGLLADDVGSGKSSMFICGFLSHAQYLHKYEGYSLDELFPIVIVTQKSLLDNTRVEFLNWFSTANVHVMKSKKDFHVPEGTHCIIVALSSLKNALDSILEAYPTAAVFDESHKIKSITAQCTKAAVALTRAIQRNTDFPYLVCASATPIPNRTEELYTQLVAAGMDEPIIDYAKSKEKFPARVKTKIKANYAVKMTDKHRFDIRYCGGKPGFFGWEAKKATNEAELNRLLDDNGMIRRRKYEFMTPLPLLYQDFVNIPITNEQREAYEIAEQEFRDHVVLKIRDLARSQKWSNIQLRSEVVEKLEKVDKAEAIMKMVELRQLVEEMKIEGSVEWIHRFFKKDPAIVTANSKKRKKLIVFVHHKKAQKEIIEHPDLQRYGVLSITSGTKKVQEIVDEFQDPVSGKNLLILYSGAQAGLTLTAAYDILILGLPFSYFNVIQMAGRCWARYSKEYEPHEAYIHYTNTGLGIDTYMIDLIKEKSKISKNIIDGEEATDLLNESESGESDDTKSVEDRFLANLIDIGI